MNDKNEDDDSIGLCLNNQLGQFTINISLDYSTERALFEGLFVDKTMHLFEMQFSSSRCKNTYWLYMNAKWCWLSEDYFKNSASQLQRFLLSLDNFWNYNYQEQAVCLVVIRPNWDIGGISIIFLTHN